MAQKTLGEYITENRRKKRMTKRKLAVHIGISATEIHRIEDGTRKNPNLTTLENIAKTLGIDKKDLFSKIKTGYSKEEMFQIMFPDLNKEEVDKIYNKIKLQKSAEENKRQEV